MTVPTLSVSSMPAEEFAADVLVIGVRSTDDGPRLAADEPQIGVSSEQLAALGVTGGKDELFRLPGTGSIASVALIGLGSAELTAETFAQAFASRKTYRDTGANGVAWIYGVARHQLGRFFRAGRVDRAARRRHPGRRRRRRYGRWLTSSRSS